MTTRAAAKVLLSAVFVTAISFAAYCQETAATAREEQTSPAGHAFDAARITVSFEETPLTKALSEISAKAGITLVTCPRLDAVAGEDDEPRITLSATDVPWEEILKDVVEKTGCLMETVTPTYFRITRPPRVTMYFKETDIKDVIKFLSDYADVDVIVSKDVKGEVTVKLTDVPFREALDSIVKTAGFVVVEEPGKILRVVDPKTIEVELETRIFHLKYLRPPDPYIPIIKEGSAFVSGTDQTDGGTRQARADRPQFEFLETVKNALSKNGKLQYDSQSNALVVTDTKPVLEQIEKLIKSLDTEPLQVRVDVKLILTRNEEFFDFGLDWVKGISVTQTLGSMRTKLPFNLGHGGFEDEIALQRTSPTAADIAAVQPKYTFGSLDFSQTEAALRLFRSDGDTKVYQAPSITTRDNLKATIYIGELVPYAQATASAGEGGTLHYTLTEGPRSPVSTGLQLFIIPHIIKGENKVSLTVIPSSTELSGRSRTMPGFETFTTTAGGYPISIDLPRLRTRAVVTQMTVESGYTAVIGGLIEQHESTNIRKVPFFGDLPGIGSLFKYEHERTERNNLIILITPWIVQTADDTFTGLESDHLLRTQVGKPKFEQTHPEALEKKPHEALEEREETTEEESESLKESN